MSNLDHILNSARRAALGRVGVLSTGERLAAALVLNRVDWLDEYTIAEALDRIGESWASLIPEAARQLGREIDAANDKTAKQSRQAQTDSFLASVDENETLDVNASLNTEGYTPGYRSASFTFDLSPVGSKSVRRVCLHINSAQDTESMLLHLKQIHRSAWDNHRGAPPLDVKPDEKRPVWVSRL
jgi:hypothetical protein